MASALAWELVARPVGVPDEGIFALRSHDLTALSEGEVLVENTWLSVDPYMRGRMGADKGAQPFELHRPLEGHALGRVLDSRAAGVEPGDVVVHFSGWRDKAVVAAAGLLKVRPGLPEQAYLGVLGGPGMTAYFGLLDVAAMREGDVVFVSGAAGAVGSTVLQLAKHKGAGRIIGSAGGADKAAWL